MLSLCLKHLWQSGGWEVRMKHSYWRLLISSIQFSCSVVSDSVTPRTAARQASLSITNSQSLLKLMSIESVMPSKHLIFCHPLLPPSIFLTIRVFSNELALRIMWSKYWSFNFSISPSNEYSGLSSFEAGSPPSKNSDFIFTGEFGFITFNSSKRHQDFNLR